MTLLLWSFLVVEGKTRKSGEKRVRVVSDRGSLRRNEARNLISTNSDTSKTTLKITTKN
jgi:hypothetical protein